MSHITQGGSGDDDDDDDGDDDAANDDGANVVQRCSAWAWLIFHSVPSFS